MTSPKACDRSRESAPRTWPLNSRSRVPDACRRGSSRASAALRLLGHATPRALPRLLTDANLVGEPSYRLPRRAFLFSLSKSAISETAASLGSTPQAQQIQ